MGGSEKRCCELREVETSNKSPMHQGLKSMTATGHLPWKPLAFAVMPLAL